MKAPKLQELSKWLENTFTEDSRPHINTARRWAENGEIPTRCFGKKIYVDVNSMNEEPKGIDMAALKKRLG